MRGLMIAVGTLFSVASLFAQQTDTQVYTNEAMRLAVQRALATKALAAARSQSLLPGLAGPAAQAAPKQYLLHGPPESTVCAIPLLQVEGVRTNDAIAHPGLTASLDSKMAVAPRVPACPRETANPGRP